MPDQEDQLRTSEPEGVDRSVAREQALTARDPVVAGRARQGMFGTTGSGDTTGFGGLRLPAYAPAPAQRPFGGWFDELTDDLLAALESRGTARTAVQQVVIDRGEITYYLQPETVLDVCRACGTTRRCASSCAARSPALTTGWTSRNGCTSPTT